MNLQIRKATSKDVKALKILWEEARQFKNSLGDVAWGSQRFTDTEVNEAIARDNTYVAVIDGNLIGSAVITLNDERMWGERGKDEKAGYLHRLVTAREFSNQHIGEQIIDWACHETTKAGRQYVRLDCPADNKKLCAYYENVGFRLVEVAELGGYRAALYELAIKTEE